MALLPEFDDKSEPLNQWLRGAGPFLLAAFVAAVIALQQFHLALSGFRITGQTAAAKSEEITDPGISELTITAKAAVKLARQDSAAAPDEDDIEAQAAENELDLESDIEELDALCRSRTDRVRVAIVAGELLGRTVAFDRLTALAAEVEQHGDLASDIRSLLQIYRKKSGPELSDEEARSLAARHGWFGSLAVSFGKPGSDTQRRQVVGGGGEIVTVSMVYVLTTAAMGLVSIVLMIGVALSLRGAGWESSLDDAYHPASAYVELFVVFLAMFTLLLGLQSMTLWLTGPASVAGVVLAELLLWSIPLCLVWLRLRGIDWSDLREDLGLTMGDGAWTEIKAGLLGYLASLPLVTLVGWLAHLVESQFSSEEQPTGYSPFESPMSGSWAPVLLGTVSAVIWAPIVEEILFRGALYRALRSRLRITLSVLISAAIFGLIHPYSSAGLVSVASTGIVLALLREWRGSLIAPITAHFLHNATISGMEIAYLLAVD